MVSARQSDIGIMCVESIGQERIQISDKPLSFGHVNDQI
jgi:hypothetical protein